MTQLLMLISLLSLGGLVATFLYPKKMLELIKNKLSKKWLLIVLALIFVAASSSQSSLEKAQKLASNTSPSTTNSSSEKNDFKNQNPPAAVAADPLTIISQIAPQKYPAFENGVIVLSSDGTRDIANASNAPWEVYVTSPIKTIRGDCSATKTVVYNIMRAYYTNQAIKDKISFIHIQISPMVNASLGRQQANGIHNWNDFGPTVFAQVLSKNAIKKDTTLPPEQQTYWDSINGNCNS